ncbi:RNA recognition motif domain-containing protein [Ditylenchus destructor]|nr:RNA recognition motif domain-containing protein [Ditylenchus destructor]
MDRALNSLPHCIDGKEIKNVKLGVLGRKQLTLLVLDLSPKTTKKNARSVLLQMHLALDAQPHVIDGTEVFLQYATHDLDLFVTDMPEGITKEALLAFYSKYGQLRECRLHKGKTGIPHAFMSYSAVDEVNRVMEDRPHIIDGKPLKIKLLGRSHFTSVFLFVGSLPKSVTEETLRIEFSKFGKLVFWKVENDGRFNQSGP